jgi:hypothetical protein
VRDAAERYRADPVAGAVHELWRVLPAVVCRVVLLRQSAAVREQIGQAREIFDVERFLRDQVLGGLNEDEMLGQNVDLLFRQLWVGLDPWTVENLQTATEICRKLLESLPSAPSGVRIGQANNENYAMAVDHDPLVPVTTNILREVAEPRAEMTEITPTFEQQKFAATLLDAYFGESEPAQA